MNKDEMKNRISMALKDPILQQGFEIICKEIKELKKACDETQELLDKQIEATYKLDKENAELKKELEISQRCWQDQKNISLDTNCKLHKAKEIIKGLLIFVDSLGNYSGGIFNKAEQFLKEVSE